MPNPSSYFLSSSIVQKAAPASSPPLIAPTFAGVTAVTANSDGSFTVNWSAASGSASTPYSYNIYVALGSVSAVTLFQSFNIVQTKLSPATDSRVFQLANGVYFVQGSTYTFGVRAVSSNGFAETNMAITTSMAIASGNVSVLLQTQVGLMTTQVGLMATEVTDLTTQVGLMTTEVTDFTTQVGLLTNEVGNLAAEVDALDGLGDILVQSAKLNTNILVDLAGDDIVLEITEPTT